MACQSFLVIVEVSAAQHTFELSCKAQFEIVATLKEEIGQKSKYSSTQYIQNAILMYEYN